MVQFTVPSRVEVTRESHERAMGWWMWLHSKHGIKLPKFVWEPSEHDTRLDLQTFWVTALGMSVKTGFSDEFMTTDTPLFVWLPPGTPPERDFDLTGHVLYLALRSGHQEYASLWVQYMRTFQYEVSVQELMDELCQADRRWDTTDMVACFHWIAQEFGAAAELLIYHVAYITLAFAAGAMLSPTSALAVLDVLPKVRAPSVFVTVFTPGCSEYQPSSAAKHSHALAET
ncbi:hypothetical protein BC828DRAFT_414017 [Blastocladiella britannica]|nr:hypothetical protein BC828DRAFT_414017 [Blastocladiella britannica]